MGASRAGQLGRSAPGTRPAAAADRAVRLVRPLTALGGLGVLELLAVRTSWRSWQVLAGPAPASLPEAVVALVLAVCAVLGGWLLLSTAVAVAAHLPGGIGATSRRWAAAWAPVVTRRVAAVLVGAALGSGAVPPQAPSATACRRRRVRALP
ncbi:hypothetical protein SAMN04489867_1866 [Pedococcus dokdonensis]|uniref:Uncharacterized protein n=1 Tax=Pedococcus dokdonensis TaxID=443156 RepID=A0A1H0R704_9MICO|nr:hypothetical protein [Pedococcus dokdonensis]SDP25313.1 hypothetical protein SAMN04489867_1866 [Pedococcus dokdonensis]